MPGAPIRVLVADAQPLLASALGESLGLRADLEVIDDFPSTGLATMDAVELWRPDVLVADYWMPEVQGPAIVQAAQVSVPAAKVILTSWFHGSREIQNSLNAGAAGFLPKSVIVERVAEAIRRAHAGETPVFEEELRGLIKVVQERDRQSADLWSRMEKLTKRDLQLMALLSAGNSVEEMAQELSISPNTTKNYIDRLLTKCGARSRTQLLAMARACGLIAG